MITYIHVTPHHMDNTTAVVLTWWWWPFWCYAIFFFTIILAYTNFKSYFWFINIDYRKANTNLIQNVKQMFLVVVVKMFICVLFVCLSILRNILFQIQKKSRILKIYWKKTVWTQKNECFFVVVVAINPQWSFRCSLFQIQWSFIAIWMMMIIRMIHYYYYYYLTIWLSNLQIQYAFSLCEIIIKDWMCVFDQCPQHSAEKRITFFFVEYRSRLSLHTTIFYCSYDSSLDCRPSLLDEKKIKFSSFHLMNESVFGLFVWFLAMKNEFKLSSSLCDIFSVTESVFPHCY